MEWTREQRYRKIDDMSKTEIASLADRVNHCPWRQSYHIQPPTGLLNDPNGFSYFNGEYHLFYQWFPLGPVHGLKHWYHTKSKDLVTWENVGLGIEPTNEFDSHGVYSGSGIEHAGRLYFVYTGNTRDENWTRHPYQCLAVMDGNGVISKFDSPIIPDVPKGYTDHYRDPKAWRNGDHFLMIIGAQRANETGCVVLYQSTNLKDWCFIGEIKTDLKDFGYMWECPDYFELDGAGVLLFSPQGLKPAGDSYQNIYQSGYVIGSLLDLEENKLDHGEFYELDHGFDFYAPQTMKDPSGRRILVGWMGLPEIDYPTDKNGWAHCLTLPRVLTINNGKLIQQPAEELIALRKNEMDANVLIHNENIEFNGFNGDVYELCAEFTESTADEFGVELRVGNGEKTVIKYNTDEQKVIFDRTSSGEAFAEEYGTIRKCALKAGIISFRIFVDVSSVEVFVNNGEEVFTGRIFPDEESKGIRFFASGGSARVNALKCDLSSGGKK